jgi:methyl-accepting chemotaxis protein
MKKYSLFAIVIVLFFVIIGFSLISIYSSAEEHKQDLIDRGIEDKIFLAKSINNSLLSYETQDFFINEMAKHKDVEYIQVLDNKGVVYETSIKQDLGKVIEDKDIFGARDDGKLIIKNQNFEGKEIKLLIFPGKQNKIILVGFTVESIEKYIQVAWDRELFVAYTIVFFSLFALIIILRIIINPLREIKLSCEKIKEGKLSEKIKFDSKTEMGELVGLFNSTIIELKKSKERLEKFKKLLETKVERKTKESKQKAKTLEHQVQKGNKELRQRIIELEKFHKLTVGRELRIIELKKQNKKLKQEIEKVMSKSKSKNNKL